MQLTTQIKLTLSLRNKMTLKNTIKKMLTQYPTLFQDRAQCLCHLYCTNGNGYEWKNGQLVDKFQAEYQNEPSEIEKKIADSLSSQVDAVELSHETMDAKCSTFLQRQLIEFYRIERAKKNIDKLIQPNFHDFIQTGFTFYPLCEYAKILNIPADVKKDWLDGAKETLALLNKYGADNDNYPESKKYIKLLKKKLK